MSEEPYAEVLLDAKEKRINTLIRWCAIFLWAFAVGVLFYFR